MTKPTLSTKSRVPKICSIPECGRLHSGRGFCKHHYSRWLRYGPEYVTKSFRKTIESRFWPQVTKTETCWLWTGRQVKGYGSISWNGQATYVHRLSYFLAHRNLPELHILHKCDVPLCVNPDHLYPGTDADNTRDKMERGRHRLNPSKGERNGSAKLRDADIPVIRELLASGMMQTEIARKYGVTKRIISLIFRGESWAHV